MGAACLSDPYGLTSLLSPGQPGIRNGPEAWKPLPDR